MSWSAFDFFANSAAAGWGPMSSSATIDCTKPEGCWVDVSVILRIRSMIAGWAVIHPKRQPGAMVLEKVSRRITRPSGSKFRYEGTRLSRNS